MAVGRLPRNQRGPGGVKTAAPPPVELVAPHIAWSAALVQPQGWVDRTSQQPLVVRVQGPIVLNRVKPRIGVRRRGAGPTRELWAGAAWSTPSSDHESSAVTALGTNPLALDPGRYEVLVAVDGTVLRAGTIAIR